MSYLLKEKVKATLEKPLGGDAERVTATLGQDHQGEDILVFQVVLADELAFAAPSKDSGARLKRITMALRDRAAKAGLPMFASVRFIAHSELPRKTKKTA